VAEARFYLLPKIGDGIFTNPLRPKYTDDEALGVGWSLAGRWSAMDYGLEDLFLMGADVTPEEHALLDAQADVTAIPTPIASNVTAGALGTVQSRLESVNLPGSWVTTAFTYQQVLAIVGRVVAFAQRYHGLYGTRLFSVTITLNTQVNQLTAQQRQRLQTAAESFGLDYSGVTGTTTMRQLLKLIADQMPGFVLRGVQF
jgi:hypothetical protein